MPVDAFVVALLPMSTTWTEPRVRRLVELLSGRWVLAVLAALEDGPLRRTALRQQLGAVSDKVLTDTLRRLEAAKLLQRTLVAGVPPQVDHALTDIAHTLWPVLATLEDWSSTHRDEDRLAAHSNAP